MMQGFRARLKDRWLYIIRDSNGAAILLLVSLCAVCILIYMERRINTKLKELRNERLNHEEAQGEKFEESEAEVDEDDGPTNVRGRPDNRTHLAGESTTTAGPFRPMATIGPVPTLKPGPNFGHFLHGSNKSNDGSRTDRPSSPDQQTPLMKLDMNRDGYRSYFSSLAKKAPESFKTLQRNGMVHEDGTPTGKGKAYMKSNGFVFGNVKKDNEKGSSGSRMVELSP